MKKKKNTFSDQHFTTFNDLPKAIRIIDHKKDFTENQYIYIAFIAFIG